MACFVRGVTAVALAVLAAAVFAPTVQAACSSPVLRGANLVVSCPAVANEQAFIVPAGVSTLRVIAVGAKGGGTGAVASGQLRVTPGSTLYVLVGGDGVPGDFLTGLPGPGGFNGGGSGGSGARGGGAGILASGGSGGGGASDLRTCSVRSRSCDTLASRLIVAAGGGGSGGGSVFNDFSLPGAGGAGGTQGSGSDGMASFAPSPGVGGAGATATAGGGAGGTSAAPGTSGAGGRGANAGLGTGSGGAGGGGGGGLFGGGGGGAGGDDLSAGAGGGGGSSFGPPGTTFGRASLGPLGSVTIAYAATPPAVVVKRPRAGQLLHRFDGRGKTRKRRQLVISGHAFDSAGVQGVALTLERLPRRTTGGRRCTWLHPTRGLRRNSCNRPPPLIATLNPTGSWTYRLSKRIKLPPGRYRVSAYGKNTPGLFGNFAPRRARIVTFRLSQR